MRKTHELKIYPEYFEHVLHGWKKFEIRKNDRDFQSDDLVVLKEYLPASDSFTGRKYWTQIGYVFKNLPGLKKGYCIFGFLHGSRIQKRKYGNIHRLNNTELRNKCRKNNYDKTKPKVRRNDPWTKYEMQKIIHPGFTSDAALAQCFNRSVQAIQQKRYMINKNRGGYLLHPSFPKSGIELLQELIKEKKA